MSKEQRVTFEQIEQGTAILREYGTAVIGEHENGDEVYELDYLKRLAELFTPGRVMR